MKGSARHDDLAVAFLIDLAGIEAQGVRMLGSSTPKSALPAQPALSSDTLHGAEPRPSASDKSHSASALPRPAGTSTRTVPPSSTLLRTSAPRPRSASLGRRSAAHASQATAPRSSTAVTALAAENGRRSAPKRRTPRAPPTQRTPPERDTPALYGHEQSPAAGPRAAPDPEPELAPDRAAGPGSGSDAIADFEEYVQASIRLVNALVESGVRGAD